MKKQIAVVALFFLSLISNAQLQGPDVAWKHHDIPADIVDGAIITGLNPGGFLTFDESGEDWWYDIQNVYESDIHTGYIVCGFATWLDIEIKESLFGGCSNLDKLGSSVPLCGRPALDGEE